MKQRFQQRYPHSCGEDLEKQKELENNDLHINFKSANFADLNFFKSYIEADVRNCRNRRSTDQSRER